MSTNVKIGIICPSEIALRRFMPAISGLDGFTFAGIGIADNTEWKDANEKMFASEFQKAKSFTDKYGGKIFNSYRGIVQSEEIDAIYLPLPPALHYKWAKNALMAGKHILVEKPATTSLSDTLKLIELAKKMNLAVHENYMFVYHSQLSHIDDIIRSGEIGDVRLYSINFGFPRRSSNDFRYKKAMGGGALLDAGGYTLKYASMLLGETARVIYTQMNYTDEFEVDISGSAALVNEAGVIAQVGFGMDNDYRCDLNVWGSKGTLFSGRVLTAPVGYTPEVVIEKNDVRHVRKLNEDDSFKKSILHFKDCIINNSLRAENYYRIEKQACLVEAFYNARQESK